MVYKPIIELNETSTRAVKAVTSWFLLSLFTKGTVECISNQIQIQMIIKSIKKKKSSGLSKCTIIVSLRFQAGKYYQDLLLSVFCLYFSMITFKDINSNMFKYPRELYLWKKNNSFSKS